MIRFGLRPSVVILPLFWLAPAAPLFGVPESPPDTTINSPAELLPGVVEPVRLVRLMPRVEGVVEAIDVKEGQHVQRGMVLAKLDSDIAQSSVAVAQAMAESESEIHMAETNYQQAQRLLDRVKQAHQNGVSSDLELDQATSAAEQASFRLSLAREQQRRARAELQLELTKLEAYQVTAPFEGRVLRVACRVGQSVTRTDELLVLACLKDLQVDLYLPVRLVTHLKIGEDYTLIASAPVDGPLVATLTSIEPQIDPASQTCRCRFRIDNADEAFPSGFTVTLSSTPTDSISSLPR